MAASLRFQLSILQKLRPLVNIRHITTSKNNKDTAALTATQKECITQNPAANKNWVSYGFDRFDEATDRTSLHMTFFGSITLCLVFGGWYLIYAPDVNLKHWAQREAFIELRRREAAKLPAIDCNLVNPEHIKLPTDEELEDIEIII